MGESIVIVGGGFAGMQSARRLRKRFRNVTLVDAKQYFEYTPGMHRPIADPKKHHGLVFDYSEACTRLDVAFVWGFASGIDDDAVTVRRNNSGAENQRIPYDFCIVSVGCHYGLPIGSNRRDTPISECLWYPTLNQVGTMCGPRGSCGVGDGGEAFDLDSLDLRCDERTLAGRRMHLDGEYAAIKRLAEVGAHVAVIGGGFVGVEFAMELAVAFPQLEITVVEKRGVVVNHMPQAAREYAQSTLESAGVRCLFDVDYTEVMQDPEGENNFWGRLGLSQPERFYMSTGLRPHADFLPAECRTEDGWVRVNEALQISRVSEGGSAPSLAFGGRVFAAGNCVGDIPGIGRLPKNVFPAEHMAVQAVSNIIKLSVAGGLPRRLSAGTSASSHSAGRRASHSGLGLGARGPDSETAPRTWSARLPCPSDDSGLDTESGDEVMRTVSKKKVDPLIGLEVSNGGASPARASDANGKKGKGKGESSKKGSRSKAKGRDCGGAGASGPEWLSRLWRSEPAPATQASSSSGGAAARRAPQLDPVSHPWPGSAVCALSLGPRDGVCALTATDRDSGYTMLKGRAVILQKDTIQWSKVDEFKSGSVGSMLWSLVH